MSISDDEFDAPPSCPICRKAMASAEERSAQSFRPFCSDRCRLVDLGRWLDGVYQVEVVEEHTADGR